MSRPPSVSSERPSGPVSGADRDASSPPEAACSIPRAARLAELLARELPEAIDAGDAAQPRALAFAEALKRWLAQVEPLLQWIPDGIAVLAEDGTVAYANAAATRLLDGRDPALLVRSGTIPPGERVGSGSGSVRVETAEIELGLACVATVAVLRNAPSEPQLERSRVEVAQLQLEAVLDQLPCGVLMVSPSGRMVLSNKEAARIFGGDAFGAESFTDYAAFTAVDEGGRALEVEDWPLARAVMKGEVVTGEEITLPRQGGQLMTLLVNAAPVLDRQGKIMAAVSVFVDSTERRRVQAERDLLLEKVQDADRRKDEFLAMLAHELRTPLSPIQNALDLMRVDADAPASITQPRELIEHHLSHLVRLIDDLLDVARITRGVIGLRRERVDLTALVNRALDAASAAIAASGVQVRRVASDVPVMVSVDPVRIAQAVTNLLGNAIKYSDPGSEVSVETGLDAAGALVCVRDAGVGIEASLLPRIFDAFVQGRRSLARSTGGLGVGLTVARRVIELHGGTLRATSDGPGKGSQFTLRVPPVALDDPRTEPSVTHEESPESRPRLRVLVVEDHPATAESTRLLLEAFGQEVRVALDGPTALEIARKFQPALVLVDIGLPGMDGFAVARQLRAEQGGRPMQILTVSGYSSDDARRRSHEAGCDGHLVKPAKLERLLEALGLAARAAPSAS